jgi:hypothetical protein
MPDEAGNVKRDIPPNILRARIIALKSLRKKIFRQDDLKMVSRAESACSLDDSQT